MAKELEHNFIMNMFLSIFNKKDSNVLDTNWIGLQQMCGCTIKPECETDKHNLVKNYNVLNYFKLYSHEHDCEPNFILQWSFPTYI